MRTNRKIRCDGPVFSSLGSRKRCVGGCLTLQAAFPLLISLALVAKAAAGPAYPLKPSANGRYLLDSNNAPFLIIGDAPHSIVVNLSTNDATSYLTNRGTGGVTNTLWIELLCDTYTGGPAPKEMPIMGMTLTITTPSRAH
jgi:hypothetical protein